MFLIVYLVLWTVENLTIVLAVHLDKEVVDGFCVCVLEMEPRTLYMFSKYSIMKS